MLTTTQILFGLAVIVFSAGAAWGGSRAGTMATLNGMRARQARIEKNVDDGFAGVHARCERIEDKVDRVQSEMHEQAKQVSELHGRTGGGGNDASRRRRR